MIHSGKASCFATLKDLAAFKHAKSLGMTDEQAFAFGDNGIGYWGDNTAQTDTPFCAIPPEELIKEWGSISAAHKQEVLVTHGDKSVFCMVGDTMPHERNIKNGAIIDLNPACLPPLGFSSDAEIMIDVTWEPVKKAIAV